MGTDQSQTRTIRLFVPELMSEQQQQILTGKMTAACEIVRSIHQELLADSAASAEFRKFAGKVAGMNNKLLRAISFEAEVEND